MSVDAKILSQFQAIQSVLHTLPNDRKICEFLAEAINTSELGALGSICLGSLSMPIGELKERQCKSCPTRGKNSEDYSHCNCDLANQEGIRAFCLAISDRCYGYMLFRVEDETKFTPYKPFLQNFANAVAVILENRRQAKLLADDNLRLDRLVGERASELSESNKKLKIEITEHKRTEGDLRRQHDIQTIFNEILAISMKPCDLEEILDCVLELIVSVPWLTLESKGAIFLTDKDKLVMKSSHKLPASLQKMCARIPFGRCLCGKAAASKKLQFTSSLDKSHEIQYKGISPHGHYCVPILSSGNVLGVLNLYVKEGHRSHLEEENLLYSISNLLAEIIERKQAEEALWRSEAKYRSMFSNMLDGVAYHKMLFDENGKPKDYVFLEVNDRFQEYTGLKRSKIIGKKVTEIIPGIVDADPDLIAAYGKVAKTGKPAQLEIYFKPFDRYYAISSYSPKKGYFVSLFHDVTERRKAEEKLRVETSLRQTLLDNMPCAALLITPYEREIVACNEAALNAGAVVGKQCFATWADSDEPCPWCLAKEAWETGDTRQVEVEINNTFWDTYWVPITKDLYLHYAFDITESKKVEQELKIINRISEIFLTSPDEEMFADVLDVILEAMESKYGVFAYIDDDGAAVCPSMTRNVWDKCQIPDKSIVFPPDTWAGIWGRTLNEKKTLYSNEPFKVPPGHLPITRVLCVPIIHQEDVIGHFEVANKATDYNEKDIKLLESLANHMAPVLHARLQRDKQGKDRKLAEEALRENEAFIRAVMDHLPIGVAVNSVDPTVDFTYMNDKFPKFYRTTREALAASDAFWDVVFQDPEFREEIKKRVLDDCASGNTELMHWEDVIITRKGEETTFISARNTPIPDKQLMVSTVLDVTIRKKAEQELEKHRQHLKELVKERTSELQAINRELQDFAYIVSHDLKAPLRGISQLSDWLIQDYTGAFDEKGEELMGLLAGRARRMHSFIDGILEYSRVGRSREKIEPVNLNRLLKELVSSIAPPENIQISIAEDLPEIVYDKLRILQVFQNLIGNAVKFMDKPSGGKIEVECSDEGSHYEFSVSDNGPGIEKRHQNRIFQIFQTLTPRDKLESTGVGLTIVKKIVELCGGRIWVESKAGIGSAFFFTVPKPE